ncbi:MAG: ribosome maturation factor RimM [Asticcacaulis sp.]
MTAAREHKGALLVRAKEAPDRTAAERLVNLKLYVPRADLPEPDEDEYYITDLIGMAVVDTVGQPVGRVTSVDNFGAGDLLDIKPAEGASFYLLFTAENVPEVRLASGRSWSIWRGYSRSYGVWGLRPQVFLGFLLSFAPFGERR